MPPSGFSPKAIHGLLAFVRECYADLDREVKSGKHPSHKAAVEHEIAQINKALAGVHIDQAGNLVDKPRA